MFMLFRWTFYILYQSQLSLFNENTSFTANIVELLCNNLNNKVFRNSKSINIKWSFRIALVI